MYARRILILALICWPVYLKADIYRVDNGQLVPGTEGIGPGPGVELDHRQLQFSNLSELDLSDARFQFSDLTNANLFASTLTNANFAGANLSNANLRGATLTNANLTGAKVAGAAFGDTTSRGFTQEQLASTASYQAKDLHGIDFGRNDLAGWNFSGQNLSNARLGSTLTDARFDGAVVTGALLRGFTFSQLASTACYQARNLQGVYLSDKDLTGWNLSGQNLTNASLDSSILAEVDLTGAFVAEANLSRITSNGFTKEQLYSTASHQAKDLHGIDLTGNDLTDWDLSGQNLTNALFDHPWGTGTTIGNVDLTGAVVEGAMIATGPAPHRLTKEQLYSTASYEAGDLRGIWLHGDMSGWDFSSQNLSHAVLDFSHGSAIPNLAGAIVSGASLQGPLKGVTFEQLASTASYSARDLRGINLRRADLTNGDLSGQNLTNAVLTLSQLTNANLAGANLKNTNLSETVGLQSATFSFDTVYNQWTKFPSDFDPVASGLRFEATQVGDFDANGVLDIDDLNLLTDDVPGKYWYGWTVLPEGLLDLTGDMVVDDSDPHTWVTDIKQTSYGDANLDGEVNFADFLSLSNHFGQAGGWSEGDFDFSGEVQFSDFLVLADNFGNGVAITTAVPEPSSPEIAVYLGLIAISWRMRSPRMTFSS